MSLPRNRESIAVVEAAFPFIGRFLSRIIMRVALGLNLEVILP
jgi:hypothetical protein